MTSPVTKKAKAEEGDTDAKRWAPLEANPEVMEEYLNSLGADTSTFSITDVYGTDPDLLAMVPRPVKAVVMAYDIDEETNQRTKEQLADTQQCEKRFVLQKKAAEGDTDDTTAAAPLYYAYQNVSNACGTMALLHAVGNNSAPFITNNNNESETSAEKKTTEIIKILPDSILHTLVTQTLAQSPQERAEAINSSTPLEECHQRYAQQGESNTVDAKESVEQHFCAFIHHNGSLVELDGRVAGPVDWGVPCTPDTVLEAAAQVIRDQYIAGNEDARVAVVALVGKAENGAGEGDQ